VARIARTKALIEMAAKQKFEEQIAALEQVRQMEGDARKDALRKALENRNNFIVGKAAELVRELRILPLVPDLLSAYDRFFSHPEKSDPQCWAKNSISRTLDILEHQDAAPFLRGLRHIQMEPVWGGQSDTAGTLRATCALALVQCRSIPEPELLAHLVDLLADKEKSVRTEVVRAIGNMNSTAAALVLRTKAVLGDDEPEVMGSCFGAFLSIEGTHGIEWVSSFLDATDDKAAEAALAIAGTRSPEAFDCLRRGLENAKDAWRRSVLLSAVALTRQPDATEFLLELISAESPDSEAAIEAVVRSAPSEAVLKRLEGIVARNPRLSRFYSQLNANSR
jgi:hypothetical protein